MEKTFDPNAAAVADSGIFGLPCTTEEAQIIIIPVEWELTTSYNCGTVDGPSTIMEASMQVDLCHHDYPDLWQKASGWTSFRRNCANCTTNWLPSARKSSMRFTKAWWMKT